MQMDFYSLRDTLKEKSLKFDSETLKQVPYHQLYLCSLAVANPTTCSLKLVREEKQRRRDDHLPYLFSASSRGSQIGLQTLYDLRALTAPSWSDLVALQRLWLKLNCLYTHTDNFAVRTSEAFSLLNKSRAEGLDEEVVMKIMARLKTLQVLYPKGMLSEMEVREKLHALMQEVTKNLSTREFKQIEPEILKDYSCLSDCFRVLV